MSNVLKKLLKPAHLPFNSRKGIPLLTEKSAQENALDPYERYDERVLRQSRMLMPDLRPEEEMMPAYRFVLEAASGLQPEMILEIGCGVGRLLGELAKTFPTSHLIGMDLSYNMLRQASQYLTSGERLQVDLRNKGWKRFEIAGKNLSRVELALARAEALPFLDNQFDLCCSVFLLDRLSDPLEGLREMFRVTRPGGCGLLVTPYNFQQAEHWEQLGNSEKLKRHLHSTGWKIKTPPAAIQCSENLDAHGNRIDWFAEGWKLEKTIHN